MADLRLQLPAERADETPELRSARAELEALRGEVQRVSRKLPLQQQQDVYHWRLHVQLILNEALERLGRMETAPAR